MKIHYKFLVGILVAWWVVIPRSDGSGPQSPVNVDDVLHARNSITSEWLRDPANQEKIARLKTMAVDGDPRARLALVNGGEAETTASCLSDLRSDGVTRTPSAAGILSHVNRPDLIATLAEDLNREEPVNQRIIGEDLDLERPSVYAGMVIRGIIIHGNAFSGEMKTWAKQVEKKWFHRNWAREATRIWWRENQSALAAGNYTAVKPPSKAPAFSPD